ncbi:FecR family protein [Flavobacterium sp. UBA4197]|uniref:FecR family protein n=1 Tax=Flavobacterium sp. UBA4197 TaxID=1946546 RepID=UPI00257E4D7B|nr:FecR domain-containing protein [Flavobacterium sp. UBA4197]
MKTSQNIPQLYKQFLSGRCTPEELQELFRYFGTTDEEVLRNLISQVPDEEDDHEPITVARAEKLGYLYQNIKARTHTSKAYKWKYAVTIAATLFIISTFIIYFLKRSDNTTVQQAQVLTEDVKPGKQAATLTLADGRKIFLSDAINGKIAEESGVRITKDKNGLITYEISGDQSEPNSTNTLSTSRGETYQVILPDKSKVWLNAASSITYSTSLKERGEERRILLSGEAYFEVAKDRTRPFIVKTNAQEVKVLGTHFNVNSYADKNRIVTTLEEGSVQINPLDKRINPVVLKPGQQSQLSATSLSIEPANMESVLGWKNGLFVFEQASVPDVMKEISRWYNIDVEYNGKIPDDKIGGGISRQSDLSAVLRMLELVNVKYKIVSTTSSGSLKIVINP